MSNTVGIKTFKTCVWPVVGSVTEQTWAEVVHKKLQCSLCFRPCMITSNQLVNNAENVCSSQTVTPAASFQSTPTADGMSFMQGSAACSPLREALEADE